MLARELTPDGIVVMRDIRCLNTHLDGKKVVVLAKVPNQVPFQIITVLVGPFESSL